MRRFLSILLLVAAISAHSQSFYQLNLRQYLNNHSNIKYPNIDLYLTSRKDSLYSVTFYSTFYDFQPSFFYLQLDSLLRYRHNLTLGAGDTRKPNYRYSIRGLNGEYGYGPAGFAILIGKDRDLYYTKMPTFEHNRYFADLRTFATFTQKDTTSLYYVTRSDDSEYSPYTLKHYAGIMHRTLLGSNLNIRLNLEEAFLSNGSTYTNMLTGGYSGYFNIRRLLFSLRGQYVPEGYNEQSNLYYVRGRFQNAVSFNTRITDELSLGLNHQYVLYLPSDSLSFIKAGIRASTRIPYMPVISASFDYSSYVEDRTGIKDWQYSIDAYKTIDRFLVNVTFSDLHAENYFRKHFNTDLSYTFENRTRMGIKFDYSGTNYASTMRSSAFVRWSPVRNWQLEHGIDFGLRNSSSFISNYLFSTFSTVNMNLNLHFSMIYEAAFYMQATASLSVFNELKSVSTGYLSGNVFYDKNRNGIKDSSDIPVSGITVLLNDSIKARTNSNGYYSFNFVSPGRYNVILEKSKLPAYFDEKKPFSVTIANFRKSTQDIPLIRMGSSSGYVFNDINQNGIKDEDEEGIPFIIIRVKGSDNYTYTDRNGYYTISNLAIGNYIIEIPALPEGYEFSIPDLINYISIDENKSDFTVDFGIIKKSKPVKKKVF